MRWVWTLGLLFTLGTVGCATGPEWSNALGPPVALYNDNPILVPARDPALVWEHVADVIDDYFKIKREEAPRGPGTEGLLETYPEVGSTIFEPWRNDSSDTYEKLESTVQSIRRTGRVRVMPASNGYWIEVEVKKELEDVKWASHATAGSATFYRDNSLTRINSATPVADPNKRWIELGRDRALEQRILAQLEERLGVVSSAANPGANPAAGAPPAVTSPLSSQPVSSPPGCVQPMPVNCRKPDAEAVELEQKAIRRTSYRIPLADVQAEKSAGAATGAPSARNAGRARNDVGSDVRIKTSTVASSDDASDGCAGDTATCDVAIDDEACVDAEYEGFPDGFDPWAGPAPEPRFGTFSPGLRRPHRRLPSEPYQDWVATFPDPSYKLPDYPAVWRSGLADVLEDHRNFYGCDSLFGLSLGIGLHAVSANSGLDEDFQVWHEKRVATNDLKRFSDYTRELGNGWVTVPIFVGASLLQPFGEETPAMGVVGEWGSRSVRTTLVGGPPMLLAAWCIGSSRPGESPHGARWDPFRDDNSVSGHAFVGAVPFLNAAMMSEPLVLKLVFYSVSILPAWSRVTQNRHYLSQAAAGWWFAYLAADAVARTERGKSDWLLVPWVDDETLGVCAVGQW